MYQTADTENSAAVQWPTNVITLPPLPTRLALEAGAGLLVPVLLITPFLSAHHRLAAIAGFVAFCIPGLMATFLLFKKSSMQGLQRLPVAFVLSMGIAGVVGLAAFELHVSPQAFYWTMATISAGLAAAVMVRTIRQEDPQPLAFTWKRFEIPLLVLMLITLVVAFRMDTQARYHVDDWTYLSYVREYADMDRLAYTDPTLHLGQPSDARVWYNIWLLDQAYVGKMSGVNLVAMDQTYLRPFLAVLALLATFALGKEITGRNIGGALASVAQLVHYISAFRFTDSPGNPFFFRMVQDKTLATLILLPIGALFMIRYLKQGGRINLLGHGIVAMALATTHPTISVFYPLTLGLFGGLHVVLERNRQALLRVAILFPVLLPSIIIPLIQKIATGSESAYVSYSIMSSAPGGLEDLRASRLWPLTADGNLYMMQPYLFLQVLTIAALLMLPVIAYFWRKDIGARFLLAVGVAVPLLLYNPIATPILGRLITPWQLWKLVALFPTTLIVAFVAVKLIDLASKRLAGWKRNFATTGAPSLLILCGVVPAVFLGSPSFISSFDRFQYYDELRLENASARDLLLNLGQVVPAGSLVLANPDISLKIPAFYSNIRVLTPYDNYSLPLSDAPPTDPVVQRRNAGLEFFAGNIGPNDIRSMLAGYGVKYVVVELGSKTAWQMEGMGPGFTLVRRFGTELLYAIDPSIFAD